MTTVPDSRSTAQAGRESLESAVSTVKAAMPDETVAIEAAVKLVATGQAELSPDGLAATILFPDGRPPWHLNNGTCPCEVSQGGKAWCVHLLARALLRKTYGLMQQAGQAHTVLLPDAEECTEGQPQAAHAIPQEYLVQIHGKTFVRYAGLLALAHAQGLLSLTAELVSVTADLAIAKATAKFKDGSVWTEAADATPGNVNKGVKAHYPRCVLTRAKARYLRDALNLDLVAAEALAE